MLQVEAESS